MEPLSIVDIFTNIFTIVSSSTFFLVCLIISVVLLISVLIGIRKFKKIVTIGFIGTWGIYIALLIIKYHKYLLSIMDNFVENVFMSIYFPNISIFVVVLLISNILLFVALLKDMKPMFYRITWITSGILINFLFIMIIDIVVQNNVDVYTDTQVYSNKELFVLLNTSMFIVTINAILTFITSISSILINRNNKKLNKENEKINQNINQNKQVTELPKNQNNLGTNNTVVNTSAVAPLNVANIPINKEPNTNNVVNSEKYTNTNNVSQNQNINTTSTFINNNQTNNLNNISNNLNTNVADNLTTQNNVSILDANQNNSLNSNYINNSNSNTSNNNTFINNNSIQQQNIPNSETTNTINIP